MGRKPHVEHLEGGDVVARIRIPRPLWLIASWHVEQVGLNKSDTHAIVSVFEQALAHLGARLALVGKTPRWIGEALGLGWEIGLRETKRVYANVIRSGGPTIDLGELHREGANFVGVVKNAAGYEALGRSSSASKASIRIGVFDTAEEAAWARRQYYAKHNLPYGKWEKHVDHWRSLHHGSQASDAQLLEEIKAYNEEIGMGHENAAPGLPENPSTLPPSVPQPALERAAPHALEASTIDDRDPKPDNVLDVTDDQGIAECRGCGEILDVVTAYEHHCKSRQHADR